MPHSFSRWIHVTLLFVVAFTPCSSWANKKATQVGLFWQISQPNLKPSYLFGTIHSSDPRVTQLPSLVQHRFEQADSVTLEININLSEMVTSLFSLYLSPEQTLDKLMDKKEYRQIIDTLQEYGMPEEVTKRLKPWATMMIISMPKPQSGQVLDALLYQKAQSLQKSIYGLETVEEQLAVFEGFSLDEQLTLLKGTLSYIDEMPKIMEELHTLYLKRDLNQLLAYSQDYMQDDVHSVLIETFMRRLIDERNVRMVERMETRLQEGNAFIAVGALHLPGEQGILNLLEKAGYQVSALY